MLVSAVYCYSLNYRTGKIIERLGTLRPSIHGGHCFDERRPDGTETGRYMTFLASDPGTTRGSTVWFYEPNFDGAVEAFRRSARRLSNEYEHKRNQSEIRTEQEGYYEL